MKCLEVYLMNKLMTRDSAVKQDSALVTILAQNKSNNRSH